jgi:hypothetical protein
MTTADTWRPNPVSSKKATYVAFTVSALLRDHEMGKLDTVNGLLDRVFGKPLQQVEMGAMRNDIPDAPDVPSYCLADIGKVIGRVFPVWSGAAPEEAGY